MSLEIALERIKTARENNDTILDLSNLGLTEIPGEIAELKNLGYLFLEENRLTTIDSLAQLRELKILSLGKNQLVEIPMFLMDLRLLFLWKNIAASSFVTLDLRKARALIQWLTRKLEEDFDIYIQLFMIPIRNLDLKIDQELYAQQEITRKLFDQRKLTQKLELELEQELELIQEVAREYPKELESEIVRVRQLIKTRELNKALARALNEDQISGSNQEIDLSITLELNQAKERDQALAHKLDQELNRIQGLARHLDLVRIEALKKDQRHGIYLKDNPLQAPPPEIIQQGNDAVKTFLEDFAKKASLNEVKVILVGEGASGKTSLVKRLLNSSFDKKEPQTHGIKIIKHKFKVQQQDFLVNFWDFGGQEIMHATHQFFLTKRCLYLLVLDSRKDEKAEYWLNYIQSFGGDAPVIVVLNKIDENPSFDLNRQFLSKKHPNIQAYYKVSCANGDGIKDLKKDIMSHLWGLELRSTALPKGWFKVKMQLEAMPDDYIGYAQYQSICTANHVHNPQSQKVLLELLNDLGVVLNYEQLRWYDTQVLNPLWLTNAVYRIINSPILAKSTGRFNINDLGAIVNDPRYQKENPEHWTNIFKYWAPEQKMLQFPEAKFLFIVAMMKQFEILFQLDEYHYLIPGLLSEEENTYEFKATDSTLAFVIEYKDFLPAAIIPRLMVKLHKYIHNNQIWKTGMVLEETLLFNSIANIVLDKESKKINIEILGNRNRDFLSVIRETLKEINTSYQDLDVTEWIPLPELYKGEQVLVDYLELLGYEKMGQQQYFSGKLLKAFPVANLLNGIEKPEMRKEFNTCHIFISYSHLDQAYKEELLKHLMPLVRLNKATLWENTSIDAGEEWMPEIFKNLEKADIVLCLISSSFIASDFCYTKELAHALEAHTKGSKKVIPIRIKEVNWDKLDIAKIQGLPSQQWMSDIADSKAWTEVSKGIEAVIDGLKGAGVS